ncbi:MAG: hypothetical protein GF331_16615 [Chitinivibrionales bacterium]|nr:hypothetical protein [Chitinivibrionales bacterium]
MQLRGKNIAPLRSQWCRLYDAARRFRAAKPWKLLRDTDLVAVTDPSTGAELYCSITGTAETECGLLAFRGSRGLSCCLDMFYDLVDQRSFRYRLDCLSLSFVNKPNLYKQDVAIVREIGVQCRGKRAWPLFRAHLPGRVPWYLSAYEAAVLTVCIEQVLAYLEDEGGSLVLEAPDGRIAIPRRYQHVGPQGIEWLTDLMELDPPDDDVIAPLEFDDVTKARLACALTEPGQSWDIAVVDLPMPVTEETPPYYPLLPVVIDSATGIVIKTDVVARTPDELHVACREIVCAALNCERMPETMRTCDPRLLEVLDSLEEYADTRLCLVESLPHVDELCDALDGFAASNSRG